MPGRAGLGACVGVALLAVACSPSAPEPEAVDPDVLAVWDGGRILVEDFDDYLRSLPPAERWPEEQGDNLAWRQDRLDEIFQDRVYAALEETADLAADDRFQVSWAVERRKLLTQAFVARHVGEIQVTEDEARDYFRRFGHQQDAPEIRLLSNLLLAFPDGADRAARRAVCERAENLRRQIDAGASFEAVARQYSDSSTATRGGLVGPVRRDQLRGQAADIVFSLEAGVVSEVVESPAGCQLFLVRQVTPAYEARYEVARPTILSRMRDAKSTVAYLGLYREQLAALGLEPPSWSEEAGPEAFAAERTYFQLGGERITGLDVLQRARTGVPPAQAVQQLASELVLTTAMEREAADQAAELSAAERHRFARQYLQRQAMERQIQTLPEEELRRYFDQHAERFSSEAAVELTLVSWPIGAGDPLQSTARPRAFAAAVDRSQGGVEEVWGGFANDRGVQRRSIPLTPLRALPEREPEIGWQLIGELQDGQVIGPFTTGRRLTVLVVDSYLSPHPMSFPEALDRVRLDYAQRHAAELARRRLEDLQREHGYRRFDDNLRTLGARLLEQLLQPGATVGD